MADDRGLTGQHGVDRGRAEQPHMRVHQRLFEAVVRRLPQRMNRHGTDEIRADPFLDLHPDMRVFRLSQEESDIVWLRIR